MNTTLTGKIAIVTGATSGIGARTAELFAEHGAHVVVAGRRQPEGEAIAAKLDGMFVRADVSNEADVAELIGRTVERYGRIDVLVQSAGDPGPGGTIADVDYERFRRTLDVHLGGVLLGMKYAAPVMSEQGGGSIVNIASIGGIRAGWTGFGYSAAKAAVIQLTRSAAIELGARGVRVNSISPGPILTGIFAKGAGLDAAAADASAAALDEAFRDVLADHQVLRRSGVPDDVANTALWLASDAAGFVTGQDIAVDGGITAGRPLHVARAERARIGEVLASVH